MMITEYFSILLRKFKKNHFYNKSQATKSHFLEKILFTNKSKTTKVKNPLFYSYPYSNNLISFRMTFIGLIFV